MSFSWPNPMFDHLLESYHRYDSNKWSNIGFGQEIMELSSIEVNFMHLIWSSIVCFASCNWGLLTLLYSHIYVLPSFLKIKKRVLLIWFQILILHLGSLLTADSTQSTYPLLGRNAFWYIFGKNGIENILEMRHLLPRSKCLIFYYVFKTIQGSNHIVFFSKKLNFDLNVQMMS